MNIYVLICNIMVSAFVSWFICGSMNSCFLKETDRRLEKLIDELQKRFEKGVNKRK